MGFAASTARLLMLTARKSDLELELQFINQSRMQLANMSANLYNSNANLEPDNPMVQQIQARISAIAQIDKILEMNAQRITKQHEAVQTEIEAVSKVISKNIQSSFGLMGQG